MTATNKATLNNEKLLNRYHKKEQPQPFHTKLLMRYCENNRYSKKQQLQPLHKNHSIYCMLDS